MTEIEVVRRADVSHREAELREARTLTENTQRQREAEQRDAEQHRLEFEHKQRALRQQHMMADNRGDWLIHQVTDLNCWKAELFYSGNQFHMHIVQCLSMMFSVDFLF